MLRKTWLKTGLRNNCQYTRNVTVKEFYCVQNRFEVGNIAGTVLLYNKLRHANEQRNLLQKPFLRHQALVQVR